MNLIRKTQETWDPFNWMNELQTDLNQALNRNFVRRGELARNFNPDIDVHEEEDRYLLRADLPGLKKEDFQISVQGGHLTLKGERKEEQEIKKKGYQYSERFYGAFTRSMEFPTDIDAEKVKATYKDGVLEVALPKSEHAKPKQINVEVK